MKQPFHLLPYFDRLDESMFEETSPKDSRYNCIAWAACDHENWWWPDEDSFWPEAAERNHNLAAFVQAFESLGYRKCDDGSLEAGFEKVVIYGDLSGPQHASRQISSGEHAGQWTSKLGPFEDIRHINPECINCKTYGSPMSYMSRPIVVNLPLSTRMTNAEETGRRQ